MKIYEIICQNCKKTNFKTIRMEITCQDCGYVLNDSDVDNCLHYAYQEHIREKEIAKSI